MNQTPEMPVETCPKCGSDDHVRSKLIATNLLFSNWGLSSSVLPTLPYEVWDEQAFRSSPFVVGDYFVAALFCNRCGTGFIPDSRATELGLGPRRAR